MKTRIVEILKSTIPNCSNEQANLASEEIYSSINTHSKPQFIAPFTNINTGNLDIVQMDKILYAYKEKKRSKYLVYADNQEVYEQITKSLEFEPSLFDPSIFKHVDTWTIVNVHKVRKYDSFMCHLYFTEDVDEKSMFVEVKQKAIAEFAVILGKEKDIKKEIGEYAQARIAKRRLLF